MDVAKYCEHMLRKSPGYKLNKNINNAAIIHIDMKQGAWRTKTQVRPEVKNEKQKSGENNLDCMKQMKKVKQKVVNTVDCRKVIKIRESSQTKEVEID